LLAKDLNHDLRYISTGSVDWYLFFALNHPLSDEDDLRAPSNQYNKKHGLYLLFALNHPLNDDNDLRTPSDQYQIDQL